MLWTFSTCISIPTRYVDLYHFVSVCPLHTHAYSDINVLLRTYNNRNSWCLIYLYFIGDLSGLKIKYETCVSWTTHNAGFQSLLNSILDVGTSRLERGKKKQKISTGYLLLLLISLRHLSKWPLSQNPYWHRRTYGGRGVRLVIGSRLAPFGYGTLTLGRIFRTFLASNTSRELILCRACRHTLSLKITCKNVLILLPYPCSKAAFIT